MHSVADPFMVAGVSDTCDPALDEVIDEVEKEFGTLMVNAKNNLRNRATAVHPQLPTMGFKVLMFLSRSGARQQGFLAEQLEIDKAMMSRTVKTLEDLGLAERRVDPQDGRAQLVRMTHQGQQRMDEALARDRQKLHNKLSAWNVDEVRRFADLLAKLNDSAH